MVVRPEQELKALAQLDVVTTGLVEVGWALFGRQRQDGIEDGLLAAWLGGRRRRGLLIVFHRAQHNQNLRMWKVVSVEDWKRRRQGAEASLVCNFWSAGNKTAPRCHTALASSARAGLLILVAKPSVGFSELGLRRLGFLLLNEGLEMLDDLVALVEHRRPIGHGNRLHEARVPIGSVQTQGGVEHLVRLHGQDALFAHVLDGAALLEVSMAEGGRAIGIAQFVGHSPFQIGNRLIELAGLAQVFPSVLFLLVAGLRRDKDIHRPAQGGGVKSGIDGRGGRGGGCFCNGWRGSRLGWLFRLSGDGFDRLRGSGFSCRFGRRHSSRRGPIQMPSQANNHNADSNYCHDQSFHNSLSYCRPRAAGSLVPSDNAKSVRKRAQGFSDYFGQVGPRDAGRANRRCPAPPSMAIDKIALDCGGKRSATPLWLDMTPAVEPGGLHCQGKRRRASLAAAVHT